MSKKGSRKITVNGVDFRWKVSGPPQIVSDWRVDVEVLDERYIEIARKFGLGDVADVVFNIVVELYNEPKSKMLGKYFSIVVDGFLGIEQFTQIRPKLISDLIKQSINNGWNPNIQGDYKLEGFENIGKKHIPSVLVFPNFNDDVVDYPSIDHAHKLL